MKSSTFDPKVASCDAAKNDAETKKGSTFQKGSQRLIAASLSLALGLGAVGSCEFSNFAYQSEGASSILISKAWADEIESDTDAQSDLQPFDSVSRLTSALSSDVRSGDMTFANYTSVSGKTSGIYQWYQRQTNTDALIELALSLTGTPYRYGGTTPGGFDCSGFTMYCYKSIFGMDLPRSAAAQSALGERISVAETQPGDLLFWGGGSGVYHVGISLGDGQYIHAAGSGKVKVESTAVYAPSFAKRIY